MPSIEIDLMALRAPCKGDLGLEEGQEYQAYPRHGQASGPGWELEAQLHSLRVLDNRTGLELSIAPRKLH